MFPAFGSLPSAAPAALVLLVALAIPATGAAIPTITVSATSAPPGAIGVSVGAFFNVFPGDVVTAGAARIVADGATTFVAFQSFQVGGAPTVGFITSASDPADAGAVFGPNVPGALLSVGAHQFATLTVNVGAPEDDVILAAGQYVQAPFCNGTVSNQGAVLVEVVPEPTAILLLALAVAGLAAMRRQTLH